MTDTNTIQSDIELEAQRATVRTIRKNREQALQAFLAALGYNHEDVRSVQVIDGSIRVHLFLKDKAGNKLMFQSPESDRAEAPVIERVLLFTQGDLDQDEALQAFFS